MCVCNYVHVYSASVCARPTHCPDCRSFSLTTAQLVSDSSSVGQRAACMVCTGVGEEGGGVDHNNYKALLNISESGTPFRVSNTP